jgi:hypothetical protein
MNTRTKLMGVAAAALTIGIAYAALSEETGPPSMHQGMGRMMRPGIGMMGAGHDSATMEQLGLIHQLLANHDHIRRTVTNLPDGIRTETTSDDPKVAEWIKTHVADMGRRVAAGDDPGLPIESPALHAIFRDKDKIQTAVDVRNNGVVVVQTSKDPKTVAELQEHASEVTKLVEGGMPALHEAMMKNPGGMMPGTMGGMMHGPIGPGMMRGPM